MRLTPTTNQGSLIWRWRSSGLLSVVGYGYVRQLLFWKLFCYGVKRDHYEKLIGIRELSERLAQD